MKISPKFVLKVAGTLTIIALVTAALLGLVDGVTRDKIAEIEAEYAKIHKEQRATMSSRMGGQKKK